MGVHVVVGLIHLAVALMLQVEAGMGFGNTLIAHRGRSGDIKILNLAFRTLDFFTLYRYYRMIKKNPIEGFNVQTLKVVL